MAPETKPHAAAAPEDSFPRPGYAWFVVIVLLLAYIVSFLDRQILTLLVEPIKQDLQISDTTVSLLHGFTFAIFYTLFGIPLGRLADRWSRTRLIVAGVALWSLMTALCGFARNAAMLFGARVGVAIGEATLSPSAYSLISDYFPRAKRGRAISIYSLGIFAGAGVAYIFGGLVSEFASQSLVDSRPWLEGFKPWQLTFILTGLPGALIIALMLAVREPERKERLAERPGGIPMAEMFAFLRRYRRAYLAILLGNSFIALMNYSLFAWTPAFFIRVYGYTPGEIGTTFGSIILLFGTAGLVLGGIFSDLRYRRGHYASHLDITIVMTALGLLPVLGMLAGLGESGQLACVALLLFCGAFSTGLVPAALQLITPNEMRGQVASAYLVLTALIGLGIGPTMVALLVDYYFRDPLSVGTALAITVGTTILVALLILCSGRGAYLQRQREIAAGMPSH